VINGTMGNLTSHDGDVSCSSSSEDEDAVSSIESDDEKWQEEATGVAAAVKARSTARRRTSSTSVIASSPRPRTTAAKKATASGAAVGQKRRKEEREEDTAGCDSSSPPAKKQGKSFSWEERYDQLKAFKKKHGHAQVPSNGDWRSLYDWLYKNKKRKNGPHKTFPQLTAKQIEMLNALDIDWGVSNSRWNEKYDQLKAFYKKHGHTQVPSNEDWRSLYQWLLGCKHRKSGTYDRSPPLTAKQIEMLDDLGVEWGTKS